VCVCVVPQYIISTTHSVILLVRKMSDKPIAIIEQVISSQNFLMLVIGAIIWILGSFVPFIGFLFTIAGFGLTTIVTIQAAMTKPVTSAFPGLLLGGIVQVIGYLILFIPIFGIFIFPFLNIPGAVLIIFYGSSLALQRADIPVVKDIEGFIDSRKKKVVAKKPDEEVVDVEKETDEESDTTEQ
jgi:hypothetical protein